MANTFKKIQTVTVGSGGASSIDFTSIPQTFTDLKIVLSARTDRAATQDGLLVKLNGSTTSFTYRNLIGDGSAASSASGSTATALRATGATATASVFSNGEYYLPNYTSANNKSYSTDNVLENNATATTLNLYAGLWSNTSAVTSISIVSENSANFVQYTTATLYGVANVPAAGNAKATGGIITYDDTYVYHTFPWSGTFTPLTSLTADYLVVAGGGGGGSGYNGSGAGGAGAGGLRCTVGGTGGGGSLETALSLTATAYTVTVGAGGTAGTAVYPSSPFEGTNGSNSVFSTITSTGGGRGIFYGAAGVSGGSGGGASPTSAVPLSGGAGTANQGFAGGGTVAAGGNYYGAGGGGGAGSVGSGNTTTGTGQPGGSGVTTSISGTSTTYAAGGRGGFSGTTGNNPTAGGANTGTGGGGGTGGNPGSPNAGAAGGSGIVIVRYAR
jgi:hypothetical protein